MRGRSDQQNSIMRSLTPRRLIAAIILLVVLKVMWGLMGSSDEPPMDRTLGGVPGGVGFKPQSCVMVNGKCISDSAVLPPPAVAGKGLHTSGSSFYLDGRPFRILSGSFHYFRVHPAQWTDRLLRMRAAGLNTVTTYVAWNLHEKIRQNYRFTGRYDIARFIQLAAKAGLKVIVRAGPYICAEWEFGGFPSWLLHDPNMGYRSSSSKPYLTAVEEYLSKLLPIVAKHTHKRGGPVIAFQLENEFGSLKHADHEYLTFLLELHKKSGIDEFFLTSDGAKYLQYGSLPGVLATVNFANKIEENLDILRQFQPNKPLMVTEFWAGWFDHWGESHHAFTASDLQQRLERILRYNASVNFYMFTGSTNFGFYNGANNGSVYSPTITSYDYDAPISECGDITEKYRAVRATILRSGLVREADLPTIPENPEKTAYGPVKFTTYATYDAMVPLTSRHYGQDEAGGHLFVMSSPVTMEMLDINNGGGQGYGYLLYRYTFPRNAGKMLTITGVIHDRAQMLINGVVIQLIQYDKPTPALDLTKLQLNDLSNTLDIFVENMGRVNYKSVTDIPNLFAHQTKGLKGNVEIDGRPLVNVQHIPYEFSQGFRSKLTAETGLWKSMEGLQSLPQVPTVYRGTFEISGKITDTFFDASKWTRGVIFINGFNLGRYWNIGPQQTLYVPYPMLVTGTNEVLVFELHDGQRIAEFKASPDLGPVLKDG